MQITVVDSGSRVLVNQQFDRVFEVLLSRQNPSCAGKLECSLSVFILDSGVCSMFEKKSNGTNLTPISRSVKCSPTFAKICLLDGQSTLDIVAASNPRHAKNSGVRSCLSRIFGSAFHFRSVFTQSVYPDQAA